MAEERTNTPTLLDKMSAEVTPATSPLLEFLTNNAKLIVVALLACFAAAGGYGVYAWQNKKNVAEAQDSLARILIVRDDADRLAKLKAFLPGAPEGIRSGVNLAVAKTAMQAKDYQEAFRAWDSLAGDTKDPLYVPAMIGKAESLSLQGKAADALALLESVTLPADSEAVNLVNTLIVSTAEQAGNIEKALAVCEKLIVGMAAKSFEESEYWRQKAAALRLAAKS